MKLNMINNHGIFAKYIPAGNYMFKVNNRNRNLVGSNVSIVNFEQVNAGLEDRINLPIFLSPCL